MRCSVSVPAPPPAWLLDPVVGRAGDTLLLCSVDQDTYQATGTATTRCWELRLGRGRARAWRPTPPPPHTVFLSAR